MYSFMPSLRVKMTQKEVRQNANSFREIKKIKDLAAFVNTTESTLIKMARKPEYYTFKIPKASGGHRLIESPAKPLKSIQKKMNEAFQCCYFIVRPEEAYGFIISPRGDHSPRNIYTNAQKHVGSKWVVNIDLKNFFHFVKTERILKLLLHKSWKFDTETALLINDLVSLDGRLPMGASTSPVLSNFAAMKLDRKLSKLATKENWVFTRFADDMTFSSNTKLRQADVANIGAIIEEEGFKINLKKIRIESIKDKPEVTGLVLKKKNPDVSKSYIKGIKKDLELFNELRSPRLLERNIFDVRSVRKYYKSIRGQVNFLGYIRGKSDETYVSLLQKLQQIAHK